MNRFLIVFLIVLCGCSTSSSGDAKPESQNTASGGAAGGRDVVPTIYAVPRPNSGTYSTEVATSRLPESLRRSIAILKTDTIVTQWKSPTQGIRIHVTADDTIEIIDFLGRNLTGLDAVDGALDSTMTDGNERSVLLTSETEGWDSPIRMSLINALFQPSVQIYLVGDDDG